MGASLNYGPPQFGAALPAKMTMMGTVRRVRDLFRPDNVPTTLMTLHKAPIQTKTIGMRGSEILQRLAI